jgi:hypothetical protein
MSAVCRSEELVFVFALATGNWQLAVVRFCRWTT